MTTNCGNFLSKAEGLAAMLLRLWNKHGQSATNDKCGLVTEFSVQHQSVAQCARTWQQHWIQQFTLLDVVWLAGHGTLVHLQVVALYYDAVRWQQITWALHQCNTFFQLLVKSYQHFLTIRDILDSLRQSVTTAKLAENTTSMTYKCFTVSASYFINKR